MIKKVSRNEARVERHKRVRDKVYGTKDIPRLNVFRSAKNITVQLIDDENGNTLVSASSMELKLKNGVKKIDPKFKKTIKNVSHLDSQINQHKL